MKCLFSGGVWLDNDPIFTWVSGVNICGQVPFDCNPITNNALNAKWKRGDEGMWPVESSNETGPQRAREPLHWVRMTRNTSVIHTQLTVSKDSSNEESVREMSTCFGPKLQTLAFWNDLFVWQSTPLHRRRCYFLPGQPAAHYYLFWHWHLKKKTSV